MYVVTTLGLGLVVSVPVINIYQARLGMVMVIAYRAFHCVFSHFY